MINQVFVFKANFVEKKQEWREKKINITLVSYKNKIPLVVARWVQNISAIKNKDPLIILLSKNTRVYGTIQLSITLSQYELFSLSDNPIHSYSASTESEIVDSYTDQTEEEIPNSCNSECNKDFEIETINRYPSLSTKAIKILSNLACINNDESYDKIIRVIETFVDESLEKQIYGLVCCLHILQFMIKRRIEKSPQYNDLKVIFKQLMEVTVACFCNTYASEITEDSSLQESCLNIIQFIQQIGNGSLCQTIFTAILFGFSLSFPLEVAPSICCNMVIREPELFKMFGPSEDIHALNSEIISENLVNWCIVNISRC